MADQFAARKDDEIIHSSIFADIASIAMEAVVYVAAGAVVAAAAAAAAPALLAAGAVGAAAAATAVAGSCVASGLIAGLMINVAGLGNAISAGCSSLANAIFPPSPAGVISTGSDNVFTNSRPAARAAGRLLTETEQSQLPAPPDPASALDYASMLLNTGKVFLTQLVNPTVDGPPGPTAEAENDKVACTKHSPPQYMAEGSANVAINDLPAVRADDRTTCEAKVSTNVSANVIIGGDAVVVRPITSGKLPGLDLVFMLASLIKGKPSKMLKNLPCMLMMAGGGMAINRLGNAINATFFPVHAATGAKVLGGEDDLDFTLPARFPLRWQRIYNSRNPEEGVFGRGWRTEFETFVRVQAGECCYHDVGGRELRFAFPPSGQQIFSADEGLIVAAGELGQLVIADSDGESWRLYLPDPAHPEHLRLASLSDEYGNGLVMHYDDTGRLAAIKDTEESLHVVLHYQQDVHPRRVTQITEQGPDNPAQVLMRYTHDESGNVISVTDAAGIIVREFGYTPEQLLAWHRLPDGLRSEYLWQKLDDWRVTEHRTSTGAHSQLEYDLDNGITRVRDELGYTRIHAWNEQFLVERYTDEAGNEWCYRWDDSGQLQESRDPQGQRWQYRYDAAGNLIEEEDPLGRVILTRWLPDRDLPASVTNPDGSQHHWYYNIYHALEAETDALGQRQSYTRDHFGQVIEYTDAKGGTSQFSYNPQGQLVKSVDCSGQPTSYRYDKRHFLTEVTDAQDESLQYEYDNAGRPIEVAGAEGWKTRLKWDEQGRLIGHQTADGNGSRYTCFFFFCLVYIRDLHGGEVVRHYDTRSRLVALRNENGESYRFVWGCNDRLLEEHGLDSVITAYQYDVCDRPISRLFAAGTPQALEHQVIFDAAGQMIGKATPDSTTTYRYTPAGLLHSAALTPRDGDTPQTVNFEFDPLGRLLAETTGNGRVSYCYDELGNRTAVTLPDGRTLKTLYYGSGHALHISLDDTTLTEFTRDSLHRETSRTLGRLSAQRQYDRLGRLSKRSVFRTPYPARPQHEQSWEYDLRHNLTREQQGTAPYSWRQYDYDNADRLQGRESNTFSPEVWRYDPAANLLDPTAQGHCQHNRIKDYQGISYQYDIYGRTVEKRRNGERWVYDYDSEHRLIKVTRYPVPNRAPVHHIHFSYDPLGRRLGKHSYYTAPANYPDNEVMVERSASETRFIWEGLRLLAEERDGAPMLYVYEDQGSYVPLARIDGREEAQVYYYHCQPNGLPEVMTDEEGHEYWRGILNSWGKTNIETVDAKRNNHHQNLRLQGQYLDRETGLHYNLFRYYDPDVGRFTQQDPIGLEGGLNLYQYAPNPLGWVDPLGLAGCSAYKGKLSSKASEMKPLVRGSKEWNQAIKDSQSALANGEKFQVKVQSSTDAKAFLQESQGNMNRYKAHTQSARADGVPKYPKGYEQHMGPEGGFGDSPHIKWYNNGTDGHIFYDIPN